MNVHESLAAWSSWGWPLLANHLWQATIVAALAALAATLLSRAPARSRYLVWVIASAKFAVPAALIAFLASQTGIFAPSQAEPSAGVAAITQILEPAFEFGEPATGETGSHNELYCALTLIWMTGSLIFFSLWLKRRW
ncbi:MAG TPA: hypothetical protein VNO70_20045, partial [Blastocatellia bacterium]|nr:hypothetical protein [Blastocatellia bacterium]